MILHQRLDVGLVPDEGIVTLGLGSEEMLIVEETEFLSDYGGHQTGSGCKPLTEV